MQDHYALKLEHWCSSAAAMPLTMEEESPDPPFQHTYKELFEDGERKYENTPVPIEERDLPVIDLSRLDKDDEGGVEREKCKREIAMASREWGFFQVVNHGISREILEEMRQEQVKVFKRAFQEKVSAGLLAGSYRWGTPSATCLSQLSWSEAFHVPLADISGLGGLTSLRQCLAMRIVATRLCRALFR